jgi:chromosome segregation protein
MLKALELSGFKSFADRTRFEFPPGISVVVGPNGSGKSNLVDAVKWVLGSQSAKSLRGQEMIDVIFNGAASRGPAGTAESTLTLDNANRRLPIDASEVHISRRVYRSGEAEYLINRQPCRLRDIRELLASTGITTEAYCIIEQGKVDALLQSSPRDRRVIFEEAAGISQFKAKKTAALRRMERVEQNLLRLSDIVDEVESRVRSVRLQAGKARRYRECADRLQELRTHVGLVDWRALTEKIAIRERRLADLFHRQGQCEASLAANELRGQQLEQALEAGADEQRRTESSAAEVREQIAARQAAMDSQQVHQAEHRQEIARCRRQMLALNFRAGNTQQQLRDLAAEFQAAQTELASIQAELTRKDERMRAAQAALGGARELLERSRTAQSAAERASTVLSNQLSSGRAQLSNLTADQRQNQQLIARLDEDHVHCSAELIEREQAEVKSAHQLDACKAELAAAERSWTQLRGELARTDQQHRQLEQRLTRTRERIDVLSELEQRLEGLDNGVRQLLRMAQEGSDAAVRGLCGVVADVFHVDVDSAPLIEVALGERAQFLVVESGGPLFERLANEPLGVADRVGFLRLDTPPQLTALDRIDLGAEPGVMGRADRFVETAPQYASLVQRLLGRTWLVDRLSTALRLVHGAGRGLDFVTSDGELLMADGTLIVGPRSAVVGILSRRNELRACHEQISQLERHLAEHQSVHARLQRECAQQESIAAKARNAVAEFTADLMQRRQETTAVRARTEQIGAERQRIAAALRRLDGQIAALRSELELADRQKTAADEEVIAFSAQVNDRQAAFASAQSELTDLQTQATENQVAAARSEERMEMLRFQLEQITRDQQEKDRVLADGRQRLASRESQLAELDASILASRQSLAELFLRKEQLAKESIQQSSADEAIRSERSELQARVRGERQQLAELQAHRHKLEVAADRLRHQRHSLCDRMQEDYSIDLASAAAGETDSAAGETGTAGGRDAIEREIAELRSQIQALGPVNIDALEELEAIESRFNQLSGQYRDLSDAKASLERIIQRINVDSRQLFITTLDTVRGHFQELFRRLFGGGEADILIEDEQDVLDCGIEIVARPPGKEACSISLLSGGEKTLTCVALLLAVFRSKPSPFCVLDEVDAALDEANIGRFIGVLRDFLSFTQFIVVTHSKKTMSGGDTLYGVTMEESGVSKRVAVRFEDVSEDGQIRASALRRAA